MENLKEKINQDFMIAFKNKEMEKKNFLGVIKGEIQNAEGRGVESTNENVMGILKKVEKSLKESIKSGDKESEMQLKILNDYLPQLMSSEEIRKEVELIVKDGATNIGMVMGAFNKKFQGKADNSEVRKVTEEILA
jgi:uncharacterized protein YqeY